MHNYTYRFADLLSDADVAELDVTGVKFDRRIIVPGAFSGSIVVSNPDIAAQVRKIIPGKTLVHVYRGSEIWGSYIIWSKRIKSSNMNTTVDLQGATLESWFYRRIFDVNSITYAAVDQTIIFRDLVNTAQAGWEPYEANADLGIDVAIGFSGVSRDRTYRKTDGASFGQRMEELANVDNGFEYMVRTYVDDTGSRVREMVWAYPGFNEESTGLNFFYPGNITSYEQVSDATEAATAFWTRGDSIQSEAEEEAIPLMTDSPTFAEEFLQNGWPHLDRVIDYSSVTQYSTLVDYAEWWAETRGGMIVIPVIEVIGGDRYELSPNLLGTNTTFTITDQYYPLDENGSPTYSGTFRIVGIEVTPPERGREETIKFVIEDDFDPTDME